jgi:hypothetical protein
VKQRDKDDFANHRALSDNAKSKSNLPIMAHIRWNDRDQVAYYVKQRSEPSSERFKEGNFSLDSDTIYALMAAQKRGDIRQVYVVLVEFYNDVSSIACDTLLNVWKTVNRVQPHKAKNGNLFWWVRDDFQPFRKVEYTDEPPF